MNEEQNVDEALEPVPPHGVTLKGPFELKRLTDWYAVKSSDGDVEILVRGFENADLVETALNHTHELGLV